MSEYEKVDWDYYHKSNPGKVYRFSPFNLNQIQYLRGLIWADKIVGDYKEQGEYVHMNGVPMDEYTDKLLDILDEFEESLCNKYK